MKLETASQLSFDPVTEAQLRQVFQDDAGRGEFIILIAEEQRYMQASGEGEGPYFLEYRDGDEEHHFQVQGGDKANTEQAFLSYLARDGRWQTIYPWEKLNLKPNPFWKFW